MNKDECLTLISQYFHMESCIVNLKNPDFKLKSHIFYYNNLFKEVEELKIARGTSKNAEDAIVFDIYFVSQAFDGLFHGYFTIKPESPNAEKLFSNISKVCTDLSEYFYYVYQRSQLLKIYLISGSLQNALEQTREGDFVAKFDAIRKNGYLEIAELSTEDIQNTLLYRKMLKKYVANFINFNSKCSEKVKMFFINILSRGYSSHVCFINDRAGIKNYIHVSPGSVAFYGDASIPVYGLLDYYVKNRLILFLKLEFDFKGGGMSGRTIN